MKRQAGAALLTAMLIVALVASLASAMVWRQYRAVQIESAERARAQAGWILQGALDWARLILREDARNNNSSSEGKVDHLGEVWAVPLAEARLSTFLGADSSADDQGPDAFLSGSIEDAQSRYNLRNLISSSTEVPKKHLRILQRLCESVGVSSQTASTLASALNTAYASASDSSSAALRPQNIDQLVWLGLSSDTVERLRSVVTLLPAATTVNLNTASREVIAALFEGLDLGAAQNLVRHRQNHPLKGLGDAIAVLPSGITVEAELASVNSDYFFVTGRLRLDDRVMEELSLIKRSNLNMQVLQRKRVNLSLQGR